MIENTYIDEWVDMYIDTYIHTHLHALICDVWPFKLYFFYNFACTFILPSVWANLSASFIGKSM